MLDNEQQIVAALFGQISLLCLVSADRALSFLTFLSQPDLAIDQELLQVGSTVVREISEVDVGQRG